MSKIDLDGMAKVEVVSDRKPDYDPMVVMRAIVACEGRIKDLKGAREEQHVRIVEFQSWIDAHTEWEEGGKVGDKPMYNKLALEDGIVGIRANIRRIDEAIQKQEADKATLHEKLEAYQRFNEHVAAQAE